MKKQPITQDLTGSVFGKLTILRYEPAYSQTKHYGTGGKTFQGRWICRCECGKEIASPSNPLLKGRTTSCGCSRTKDLTGQIFDRLTVLAKAPTKNQKTFWLCECKCGNKKEIGAYKLLSGNTKSCGCKKEEAPPIDILEKRIRAQQRYSVANRKKLHLQIAHFASSGSKSKFQLLTSLEEFIHLENPQRDHLKFKCPENHTFDIDWFSFQPRPYCRKCNQWKSQGELELRNWLMEILGQEAIIPNARNSVSGVYEVDVYLPGHKMGIEYNGLYWHTRGDKDRHLIKRELLARGGIGCLQFFSDEWESKRSIVESIIRSKLGLSTLKYPARKLQIVALKPVEATQFFQETHLMGPYKAAVPLGLKTADGLLVACLSYRICKGHIEIARFSCALNSSVMGGFSRLLKTIEAQHPGLPVISWVDLRYGTGQSLTKLGFLRKKITLGWKWTDGKVSYNRLRCRANMDSRKLTEAEHAKELGWLRVYDAGQALFSKSIVRP